MKRLFSLLVFSCFCSFLLPLGCGDGGAGSGKSCTAAEDCEDGEVCRFGSVGKCALSCDPGAADPCPGTAICDGCATGSCPECEDCVAACVEPAGGDPGGW